MRNGDWKLLLVLISLLSMISLLTAHAVIAEMVTEPEIRQIVREEIRRELDGNKILRQVDAWLEYYAPPPRDERGRWR